MNAFDFSVLVLAAALAVYGTWKGMARLLISGVAVVAAFVIANRWHEAAARHLAASGSPSAGARLGGWLVLFIATMVAGAVAGWLAARLLSAASLGWADRLGGAAVGLAGALLVAAVVTLPLAAYGGAGSRLLRGSRLAPYVTTVSDWINIAAPDGLARRYEIASAGLRRAWRSEERERALRRG